MNRLDDRNKADVTVLVPTELKSAFEAAAAISDRGADEVLRSLMQAYVDHAPEPETGHDEWFRRMVQESIDDPRPSVAHETVIERTSALLDEIAGRSRS